MSFARHLYWVECICAYSTCWIKLPVCVYALNWIFTLYSELNKSVGQRGLLDLGFQVSRATRWMKLSHTWLLHTMQYMLKKSRVSNIVRAKVSRSLTPSIHGLYFGTVWDQLIKWMKTPRIRLKPYPYSTLKYWYDRMGCIQTLKHMLYPSDPFARALPKRPTLYAQW